ncbi:DUF4253 domain-containing protein [uncultured Winogradskyella sp.]|uniref:DUF4253 domain-containing protein n=1 Tax=uncultured Winogradskyella sp. TaxID=395353 RepID=UPI00260C321D|nr:DUF4253 domain-containing protein [uncultured Winogradskyella sp.]
MKKLVYIFIFLATVSCLNKGESKVDLASNSAIQDNHQNGLTIDKELLSEIKKAVKKEPIQLNREVYNFDKDGNETNYVLGKGLVFKFIEEQKAHAIFNRYYDKVVAGNNYIFLSNMDFDESYNSYYDIIIMDGSDPFKIIEQIGTNGLNYDVYNQDILNQLKAWHAEVDFKFVVIDVARIHAYMNKLPKDLSKFTSDVYEFCPDVIDQGYSDMDEMISDYKDNKYFWLWWD